MEENENPTKKQKIEEKIIEQPKEGYCHYFLKK